MRVYIFQVYVCMLPFFSDRAKRKLLSCRGVAWSKTTIMTMTSAATMITTITTTTPLRSRTTPTNAHQALRLGLLWRGSVSRRVSTCCWLALSLPSASYSSVLLQPDKVAWPEKWGGKVPNEDITTEVHHRRHHHHHRYYHHYYPTSPAFAYRPALHSTLLPPCFSRRWLRLLVPLSALPRRE